MGLNRVVLATLVVGLTTAGAALGAGSPVAHPELDYAGSSLANRTVTPVRAARPAGLPGLDVSSWQGNVDWAAVAANGARFAFVKATEGTSYVNPYFAQQYGGAYDVGLVRGAYHFGLPDRSTGAAQAQWFAAHGGAWSADGRTLPGALDIEYNPYGATCYGLSQSAMVAWLTSFVTQYQVLTSRWPVIYTTANWWQTCTGNYAGFGAPSRSGSRAGARRRASFQPAGAATRSGSGRTSRSSSRATRTSSTGRRTTSSRSRTVARLRLRNLRRRRFLLRRHRHRRSICRVPRVIGMRLATARTRIRRAHCSPGRVRHVRSKRVGRVLGQNPRAGSRRARGARVSLLVGRKRR